LSLAARVRVNAQLIEAETTETVRFAPDSPLAGGSKSRSRQANGANSRSLENVLASAERPYGAGAASWRRRSAASTASYKAAQTKTFTAASTTGSSLPRQRRRAVMAASEPSKSRKTPRRGRASRPGRGPTGCSPATTGRSADGGSAVPSNSWC
jgi:hypothetical protein